VFTVHCRFSVKLPFVRKANATQTWDVASQVTSSNQRSRYVSHDIVVTWVTSWDHGSHKCHMTLVGQRSLINGKLDTMATGKTNILIIFLIYPTRLNAFDHSFVMNGI